MKNSIAGMVVAAVALFGMGAAFASEQPAMAKTEIQAELKKLQKAAGAGEISHKAYNARRKDLMASLGSQQVGEAKR